MMERKENIKNFFLSGNGITFAIFAVVVLVLTISSWKEIEILGLIIFPLALIATYIAFSVKSATWKANNAHRSDIRDLEKKDNDK